jgi:hypothetical protein
MPSPMALAAFGLNAPISPIGSAQRMIAYMT